MEALVVSVLGKVGMADKCDVEQYMLTVTGILRVEGKPRNFAQCFILEQLSSCADSL